MITIADALIPAVIGAPRAARYRPGFTDSGGNCTPIVDGSKSPVFAADLGANQHQYEDEPGPPPFSVRARARLRGP